MTWLGARCCDRFILHQRTMRLFPVARLFPRASSRPLPLTPVRSQLGLSGAVDTLSLARWPALLGLAVLGLTILYRYGPSLSDPQWTWLFPGNVIAAISWLVLSALFSWYVAHFGSYYATYGSLGAAIGMMTWMWISMIVVLLGAELNAEIQRKANAPSFPP